MIFHWIDTSLSGEGKDLGMMRVRIIVVHAFMVHTHAHTVLFSWWFGTRSQDTDVAAKLDIPRNPTPHRVPNWASKRNRLVVAIRRCSTLLFRLSWGCLSFQLLWTNRRTDRRLLFRDNSYASRPNDLVVHDFIRIRVRRTFLDVIIVSVLQGSNPYVDEAIGTLLHWQTICAYVLEKKSV